MRNATELSQMRKKVVTPNGTDLYSVIDTDTKEGWYEVDEPIESEEDSEQHNN